ncbi:hypothetical protein OG439_47680 [Amycolatopsis sp. NBC_01307]|uniref:hypothetical protein n=1 Tax=Amycolatopsis sp. NBC_01307 TaxID=2903561 RepID=UPI002E12FF93|nr:hypothetical protein OG439_47680 [Amycolatopsis sp. NBC_01307]
MQHERRRHVGGQRDEMHLPVTFPDAAPVGTGDTEPDSSGDDTAASDAVFGRHGMSCSSMWATHQGSVVPR